ncbi:MAG TPA: Uma2 family endonuclease [Candidatus Rifleibacterium sp.]|nr:Uma2 family endonuclease [Candidatus Rifleibacterium sp.]HPT45108.1 Uma2 family endonuclease [Candidatus Rifleibacterium sp.]
MLQPHRAESFENQRRCFPGGRSDESMLAREIGSGYNQLQIIQKSELLMRASAKRNMPECFTWADYLQWSEGKRYEIIAGQIYDMSPAPGTAHQETLFNLATIFKSFLAEGKCRVFIAPYDVRLAEKKENDRSCSNVVQPDISIICDPNKIDDKGCVGAPDLVVEILSASTASKDQVKKRRLYERHGVREYWLIHPIERYAHILALNAGKYELIGTFDDEATLESHIFAGLTVKFAEILPALKVVKEQPFPFKASSE